MSQIDLLKTSNFRLQFKDQKQLEFRVQTTNLPGFNLGVLALPRPAVHDNRPGDTLTYNDLSVNILCDEDLQAFKEIYSNIILSVNPETCEIEISKNVFDAYLFITTNKNNVQHQVVFRNAFFVSVGDLQFSTTSTGDEHINFDITLKYSYWDFV